MLQAKIILQLQYPPVVLLPHVTHRTIHDGCDVFESILHQVMQLQDARAICRH